VGSVYARKNKLWIRHKGPDGNWTQSNTAYHVGQEKLARKLLERVEAKIAAGEAFGEKADGPLTVARYAASWIRDREKLGLAEWANDQLRLRLHVLPSIGHLRLDQVRTRHLADVIRKVRLAGKAPRTVRNIYSVVSAMFRDARIADLIDQTPAVLNKYQLGQVEDAKPEWRVTAIYTRAEVEQLIADERLTTDQRVWYALQGVAGLRPGEAAPLRWSHYETDLQPLGRLLIANSNKRLRTKTGAVRQVPVHPTLARMLAEWKLRGWPELMGRTPGPEDLIIPSPEGRRVKLGTMRNRNTWSPQTRRDLLTLGLRHRRGYDLRRTFISLARTDGARADLLKLVTHGSDSQRNMMDLYSTFDWPVLCAEVAKLNVRLVERAKVVALPRAVGASDMGGSEEEGEGGSEGVVRLATPFATPASQTLRIAAVAELRRRDSNYCQQQPLTRRSCSSFRVSARVLCRIGRRLSPHQSTPVSTSRPESWRHFGNRESACNGVGRASCPVHLAAVQ
jgi:integrase